MVLVVNLTRHVVASDFIKKLSRFVLVSEKKPQAELSVVLVGEKRIRNWNRQYRHQNKVTDVLSFSSAQSLGFFPKTEPSFLGEVVICLQQAQKQAKKFKTSFQQEVGQLLIHGILHLLGYNHEKSVAEAKLMEAKEKKYLKFL